LGNGLAHADAPLHTWQSFQYFAGHALLIVGVLYLLWSAQSRPRIRSWWFAWWSLNLYGLAVGAVDFLGSSNFMYLRQKPASSSLFDFMGPWPWYISSVRTSSQLSPSWLMQLPFSAGKRAEIDPKVKGLIDTTVVFFAFLRVLDGLFFHSAKRSFRSPDYRLISIQRTLVHRSAA
jgi:hypothetical protein